MSRPKVNIKIESEDELVTFTGKLLKILVNVRYWEKKWHEDHSSVCKERMKHWQTQADELLATENIPKLKNTHEYKLEVQKTNQTT